MHKAKKYGKIKNAEEAYEIASEKEMLELTLFSSVLDLNEYNIGKKLYDRTIENSNKWDVIYDYENYRIIKNDVTDDTYDIYLGPKTMTIDVIKNSILK